MNQGIAFGRTLRALDADDFRASKLGVLAAALVLLGWTWWMLAARVPQYESTTNVRIESGRAIAYFSPDALTRIHMDQRALVRLDASSFPAQVQTVASDHAELVFTSYQPPATTSSSASAEIEISRVSPASIALRTLGRAHQ
ncbi:MAG: hypothetical protein ABSG13_13975 [Bryobacteraceae bacterium]